MQFPNQNNQYYPASQQYYGQYPPNYCYPPQTQAKPNVVVYPQQPYITAQYVQALPPQPPQKKQVPEKKPSPFSFEPGSNKELDDALKNIGNMYDDMFDTVEAQKKRQQEEGEVVEDKEFVVGIPIWNPYDDNKIL